MLLYLEGQLDNQNFTFQELTHKQGMLMALSNDVQSSLLAALHLIFWTYQAEWVRFVITGLTKSRRTVLPIEAFYPSFSGSPSFAQLEALKEYEQASGKFPITGEEQSIFITVRNTHAPVKPCA